MQILKGGLPEMSADSTKKIVVVALGVCAVCSILVSVAAVALHGIQEQNKTEEKIRNILLAGNLLKEDQNVEKIYNERIRAEIINLETGQPIPESEYNELLDPNTFDIKTVASDPKYNTKIPANEDIAQIRVMPKYMAVYFVEGENDEMEEIILPFYGKGLWSTMYGFIALGRDIRTIEGLTFYEHGETPGLGGEVDNPRWKLQWKGKQAFDLEGNLKIQVIKGTVDTSTPEAIYEVDGLSGSTLTTRGVDNMIRFWLGKNGYGPFLDNLKKEIKDEQI
jgi:Na+-transporting NADH:ubiquinone oxidoreductase subunit C